MAPHPAAREACALGFVRWQQEREAAAAQPALSGLCSVSSGCAVLAQCRTLLASVGAACHSDLRGR